MAADVPAYSIVPSNITVTPIPLPSRPTTMSPTSSTLPSSSTDTDILSYLLSPSLQHGPVVRSSDVTDEELGGGGPVIDESLLTSLRKMQSEGIRAADDERYDDAVHVFTGMIALCPQHAAAYNNRAQCYLLLHRDNEALLDLDASIQHAHTDRLTLRQSLTQRGLLYRRQGRDDEARADFGLGARLGSGVCREQLVAMNPYAAMCNAMLTRAMTELREGSEDDRVSAQCSVTKAAI